MQKACGHPTLVGLPHFVSTRFQVLFHSLTGVLFTFPSRYLFAIGHRCVFSLGGGPRIQTEFHVFRSTWDPARRSQDFAHGPFTLSGEPFQVLALSFNAFHIAVPQPHRRAMVWASPVRSPLLGESRLFSFPPVTEMFHFAGFRSSHPMDSGAGNQGFSLAGFSHSDISGSQPICGSPKLQLITSFFAIRCQGIHLVP